MTVAVLSWILTSTIIVSLLSLGGILTLTIKGKSLDTILFTLVGFSAGTLMGGAFLHLLPESLAKANSQNVFLYVIAGFVLFFLSERILYWRHCHREECPVHTFTYMNLLGDGIHNFLDGLIIAISFITEISLGLTTTFAIIAHEIPQELGDFGVLVYGGFSKSKALFFNLLSALTAVFGALLGYFLGSNVESIIIYLLPFAAGGFLYIAASDLIPELHKEPDMKKSIFSFLFFLLGIIVMWALKIIIGD